MQGRVVSQEGMGFLMVLTAAFAMIRGHHDDGVLQFTAEFQIT